MSARITAGEELETPAHLARELGFSRQRAYVLLHAGRVPAKRIGRFWFINRAVIEGMKVTRGIAATIPQKEKAEPRKGSAHLLQNAEEGRVHDRQSN